jgi:uncharacterized Zn-binding protein involved in type VI secretion
MAPAARVLDLTTHGGVITGPGCPNVLIGGMPAARVGDLQVCPLADGPKPHGGGVIGAGCPNVLIGGMPAARVGDPTICVGPTGTVAPPGCPNVLIGS